METATLPLPAALLRQMEDTPQNPRYHAEGSVLAHTLLVMEAYAEHAATHSLSPEDQQVLWWAALLHDTGKVKATRLEDGRWRSPGHERQGLPIAWDILMQHPEVPAHQRRRILDLVRWHGFPLQFRRTQEPIETLKLLGTRTDLRLLATFARLDFKGRICEDRIWVDEAMKQFSEVDVPRVEYEMGAFAELQARYASINLRHKDALWTAAARGRAGLVEKLLAADPPEQPSTLGKKVTLSIGAPLSGKTHWFQQHMPDVFRISMAEHGLAEDDLVDDYYMSRKLIEFRHFLTVYLNRHRHVVLDGCNLDEAFRRRLAESIRGMNVELEYLVFEESLPQVLARNAALPEPATEEQVLRRYAQLDLIHPWEAHHIRHIHPGA